MHIRGQLDDGIRVGNGGFRYRVDDRGQGVRGLDREIHHAGAGRRAVGDGDLDAHTSRRQRTGVERKLAVGSGGHLHLVGVLGHSGDQSERVSIRIVEAAQRIGGITGSLLTSISGGVSNCTGAWLPPSFRVTVTVAEEVWPRPSEIS